MFDVDVIRAWWPFIQAVGYVLIAIVGFGWRQVGHKLEELSKAIVTLNASVASMTTTTAVIQNQLQSHTEMDRQSFHEIRNDVTARFTEINRRLEIHHQAIEVLRMTRPS